MKLVILNEKQVNEKLALPIYTKFGMTYIKEGSLLTSTNINKLNKIGIITAYIEEDESQAVLQEIIDSHVKIDIINKLIKCFEEIIKSKVVDKRKIQEVSKLLLENIVVADNTISINNYIQDTNLSKMAVHTLEVAICSFKIAIQRNYSMKKIEDLLASAFLHDIGKLFTDEANHTRLAYKLIKQNPEFSATVFIPILQLHENIDGSGPMKIEGNKIFEGAQILHIANEYVNLQMKSILPHEIIERLSCDAARKFDIVFFRDSIKTFDCYPNGLTVVLSTGEQGVVIMQSRGNPMRPIVQVKRQNTYKVIDLNDELSIFITQLSY